MQVLTQRRLAPQTSHTLNSPHTLRASSHTDFWFLTQDFILLTHGGFSSQKTQILPTPFVRFGVSYIYVIVRLPQCRIYSQIFHQRFSPTQVEARWTTGEWRRATRQRV